MNAPPRMLDYLRRKDLPPERLQPDGSLSLALGERARMRLHALPAGGWLFEGRIAPLPPPGRTRDERIDTLLRAGASRLRSHPQALAIDAAAEAFVLQQGLDDGLSPVAFDAAVEGFLRALVFWKHVEAAR